jgi:hypothetical protein
MNPAETERRDLAEKCRRATEMYDRSTRELVRMAATLSPTLIIRDGSVEVKPHPLMAEVRRCMADVWEACCSAVGLPRAASVSGEEKR